MKRDQIRDHYPCFYAFGDHHRFLSAEEAINASFEDRIRSIWPFMVRRVLAFQASMKPRDKVNFDPEDVLTEIVLALLENDGEWTPERGKYITYATTIMEREMYSIRDRARTVQSPRNSACRLKEYRAADEAGVLTEKCRKTAEDIERTTHSVQPISPRSGVQHDRITTETPPDTAISREDASSSGDIVAAAIAAALEPMDALILGRTEGLWGRSPESPWLVGFKLGITTQKVRASIARSKKKIKQYVQSNN
jgi:DNA-directed RNA polymerase specialized sigma24 family protein